METIPKESMEVDGMTREFIEDCMRTPTVLRSVLEQFSNRELLTLSLVNKQWSFEARSVLRDRGDVTARINSREHHKSLVAFAFALKRMRVVPFRGIEVDLCHGCDKACQPSFSGSMDSSYIEILERLRWNRLAVTFSQSWDKCKDCQALKLVQKMLKNFQGALEELSLTFYMKTEGAMYEQIFQDWKFPRLKTLKIRAYTCKNESLAKFLRALVSRTPNLRTLNFNSYKLLQQNILEGSTAVLVSTGLTKLIDVRMCKSLIRSLRAETIELNFRNFELAKELLSTDIPMVLKASGKSLKTLRMDLLFAVPMMCYGICLRNVTELVICEPNDLMESIQLHILRLLTSFDFTRLFPKLQNVLIYREYKVGLTTEQISDLVEHRIAELTNTSPDRAVSIKHLTWEASTWDSSILFWAQMFPHIETLSVYTTGTASTPDFPFTLLWGEFLNLTELIVKSRHSSLVVTTNFDSAFCGIFPEEVAELMEKDDEYLKAVNIVPVMPSITCMMGLRSFKLDFKLPHRGGFQPEVKPSPKFIFSRVTALIGFARCADLAVTFEYYDSLSENALSHMKPYVSFVMKSFD